MGKVFIKVKEQFFKPGESQMYFTKSVTYSKIGFDQLIEHIAKDSGMRGCVRGCCALDYQAGGGDGAEWAHDLYQEPWVVQDVYLGEGSAGVG